MTVGERIKLEELERDPYPIYARLRDQEPVAWVPAVQLWLVTRHDDVRHVGLTPEVFTAATEPSTLNRTMGVNMLGSEGSDQRRIRRVLEPPFRPRDVEDRTQGMIPELAHELIDGFEDRGECDLFREFADPMSVRSLRFMLGLDEVPWEDLLRWNEGLMPGLANFEGDPAKQAPADDASSALGAVIERVLDRLGDEPDGSVLSWMLHHDREGDSMSRQEIVANTKLMLSGGLQEPRDLISLVVIALGMRPEQLEEVRADRALVKPAVEETLRWAGPVGTATRQTTRPVELAGVELAEGALIGAVLSSANRDPRRFTDPDRFVLHRREGAHLAFSVGNHFCLGAWFGRHLARVAPRGPARPAAEHPPGPGPASHALGMGVPGTRLDVGQVGSAVTSLGFSLLPAASAAWDAGPVRHRLLKLLSLAVTLSAVPVALIGIPTVACPTRAGMCHVVSYPRLGVMTLLVALGLLLWGIADPGEGAAPAGARRGRGGAADPA
jgi:cytochrome P450